MRRECRERFPLHLELHAGSLTSGSFGGGGGGYVPGIPGACATHNFAYLVRLVFDSVKCFEKLTEHGSYTAQNLKAI